MQDALGKDRQRLERRRIPRGRSSAGERYGAYSSSTSNWPADQMALCTNTMHKCVDNLRDSLDHTPLDWAKMPNPFRNYEGVSVVAPKNPSAACETEP
jgi:hypothetical protein